MSSGRKRAMPDACDQQMFLKVKDCHGVALRSQVGLRGQEVLNARIKQTFLSFQVSTCVMTRYRSDGREWGPVWGDEQEPKNKVPK